MNLFIADLEGNLYPHEHIRLYGFVGVGLWNRLRILKI
jgi:hypothetical protein